MMDSIAAMSVNMHAAQLQQSVSISVAKKAMDSTELAAQELLEMLPDTSGRSLTHMHKKERHRMCRSSFYVFFIRGLVLF